LVTTVPVLHDATRELASRLAARANAVLLFFHVVPTSLADGEAMLHSAVELAAGDNEAWLRRQRPAHPGVPFRHRFEAGDPEEIVARFVRENAVDLVVAEEPPRGRISETLWRGFAERLIRRVDCPVVIGGPGFVRSIPPPASSIRSQLGAATVAELLDAMVDARVEALRSWMDRSAQSVARIAASDTLQAVVRIAGAGSTDAGLQRRLLVELDEHQRALRARGWRLATADQAWGNNDLVPPDGAALAAFLQRVQSSGCSTSLPMALDDDLQRLAILSGAQVVSRPGGLLVFAFDAQDDFLRILAQPGPLPTFETYAFDAAGVMLSNSRFPDHLLASGLLTAEGEQTPLRLRIAEPSDGPVEAWPLTHMARAATSHQNGVDTRGYLDYRGTRVVGAWRWIPEYGFGVAAEVDHAAAYPR
jgi:nucleotide-binding universal stress UspA family protein